MSALQDLKHRYRAGELSKPDFVAQALDVHRVLFSYVDVVATTDVREIRITKDGVAFQIGEDDVWLLAPADEARVAPVEVMNFDRYEPQETHVMDLLAREARVVLDIGANIGWYSLRFARRLPGVQVHAFEPIPPTHDWLVRNIALNRLQDRVIPYAVGLSDRSGPTRYFVRPAGGTNASLQNVSGGSDAAEVAGQTITLDDWSASTGVVPDFVKCDVEGAELLVFRGARETLARHRPAVFAELLRKWSRPFGYHPNDMLAWFDGLGYACVAVGSAGTRPIREVTDDTQETNYAFLHRQRHGELLAALECAR
ncbi:MAG TPA: FkbM family methyltransferase [Ramlibacter sp.]|jgi:FkbM family methyltransferase|uniref:FkbM family methyltransferase n=1 Tax=Ramlibacter sp. TaxID=1917967 RepID=UPI002D395D6B|nr:FkbM family methyltransferase [Ramlibacter sp.]HZY20341.1 FkbM family methyltransferase [Ramlibacter sp.]